LQAGHFPGASLTTSGCIGQKNVHEEHVPEPAHRGVGVEGGGSYGGVLALVVGGRDPLVAAVHARAVRRAEADGAGGG
jgi:hypothetical protein